VGNLQKKSIVSYREPVEIGQKTGKIEGCFETIFDKCTNFVLNNKGIVIDGHIIEYGSGGKLWERLQI
jgi:hypothetical protein